MVAVLEGRDRDEALAKCLTDAGFPSVPAAEGGVTGEAVPDSQLALLRTAYWTCHAQYPSPTGYYVDYSADQLGVIYEYWTEFYLPCAAAHGVEVDTAQVPSRDTFVSAWLQGEQWRPDALVLRLTWEG